MKILIVDDKEEDLYLLETLLKGSGYEVVSAGNGVEALANLKKDAIDLIISDILMPKMDGFQLCKECKRDETLRRLPFVFYTATYTDKKDEEFALGLGAEKFIIKPVDPAVFLKLLKNVIKEHEKGTLVAPKRHIEDETVYLAEYNKQLIQTLEKKVLGLEMAVTKRKQVEKALKKSETHLRNVIDGLGPHMFVGLMTLEGTLIEANRPALDIAGLKPEDVLGKPFEETYWWSYSEDVKRQLRDAIRRAARGENSRYDVVVRVGEDRFITIDFCLQALVDEAGRSTYLIPSAIDITERKRVEDALRQSENKYRAIFETTGNATAIIEEDTTISLVNTEFEKLSGYSKEELEGKKSWTEFIVKEYLAKMKKYHQARRLDPDSAPRNYEFKSIDRHGNIKDIFLTIAKIPETGKSVASLLDITKRKQAEVALQKAHDELEMHVRERTAALTEANALLKQEISERKRAEELLNDEKRTLEQMNKMMIDRELRMVELKKEVNALLEELGRGNKYDW